MPSAKTCWTTLLAVAAVLSGCDDSLPPDPGEVLSIGTFEATAGSASGGGLETMAGTAHFEMISMQDGTPAFVFRLTSVVPGIDSITTIDFALLASGLPDPGTVALGDPDVPETDFSQAFATCFRTALFEDGPYRADSGELLVDRSAATEFGGSFDLLAYTLVPTGPDTDIRRFLPVSGAFRAIPGATGMLPASLFTCDP